MNVRIFGFLGLLFVVAASATAQVNITGQITTADGKPAGDVVVYLESTGGGGAYPVPADASISQKGAMFSPSLLVISAGQSVLFKNDEERPMEHNVFSRSPIMPFDLGLFKPPLSKRVTFPTAGVERLYCSIHRLMDGIIYICPTPFFTMVKPDGSYEISNVPPGDWRMKTWQRSPRFAEQDIPINTAAAVKQDIQFTRN